MIERWGYKLPETSCDKSFRSSYRATSKHCLVQDMSFIGCIELVAGVETISQGFQKLTSRSSRGIAAKMYLNGKRHGSLDLFKVNSYPMGALGSVTFIWKPVENVNSLVKVDDTDDRRTVWIFVHASFYRDVVDELSIVFDLKEFEYVKVDDKNQDELKVRQKVLHRRNETLNVELKELKDQLNYFRLTGPLSQAVLSNAFKCKATTTKTDSPSWLENFLSTEMGALAHNSQSNYWSNVKTVNSPAELCPNMVLALNIEDPRINRPTKRTQAFPADEEPQSTTQKFNDSTLEIPEFNAVSRIWDHHSRDAISKAKMSTHELCTQRNKNALVPGERCAFEDALQAVPVLLLQRPGCSDAKFKRLGYGCGWDVIVPGGYGISTWMCLIMWGARAGGLRESETVCRESGFDEFAPDTLTGLRNSEEKHQELRDK